MAFDQVAALFGAPAQAPQEGFNFETAPTEDPEELKKRASGWAEVQKVLNTPDMRNMLLKFGTQLMQPIPVGQTKAGHLANAVAGGVDYTRQVNEEQRRAALQERAMRGQEKTTEADLAIKREQVLTAPVQRQALSTATQLTEADIGQRGAQTEATRQATERAKLLLPNEVKSQALDLFIKEQTAGDAVSRAAAESQIVQMRSHIMQQYGLSDAEADLKLKNAQTEAAIYAKRASAAHADAYRSAQQKQEHDAKAKWKATMKANDDGSATIMETSQDGTDTRITHVPAPKSRVEALREAKSELKALQDAGVAKSMFGKKKDHEIILEMANDKMNQKPVVKLYRNGQAVDPKTADIDAGPSRPVLPGVPSGDVLAPQSESPVLPGMGPVKHTQPMPSGAPTVDVKVYDTSNRFMWWPDGKGNMVTDGILRHSNGNRMDNVVDLPAVPTPSEKTGANKTSTVSPTRRAEAMQLGAVGVMRYGELIDKKYPGKPANPSVPNKGILASPERRKFDELMNTDFAAAYEYAQQILLSK